MRNTQRTLLYFVLPILAPLIFPPDWLASIFGSGIAGIVGILLYLALFIGLGYLLVRGRSTVLTLTIFLQGLNAIVRLMMLFPRFTFSDGTPNPIFAIASIISIGLSVYLVLRLDQVDIRKTMVT